MLSNKDFSQILKSGNVIAPDEGKGKTRFDLEQISEWDKQNATSFAKKVGMNKGGVKMKIKLANDPIGAESSRNVGYRDRALERRKQTNPEDSKFEEIVSKLDAEQTKFLGGDLEHTHFVKGLDYALLKKVRQETVSTDLESFSVNDKEDGVDADVEKSSMNAGTIIGSNIRELLLGGVRTLGSMQGQESVVGGSAFGVARSGYANGGSSTIGSIPIKSFNGKGGENIAAHTALSRADIVTRTSFSFEIDPNSEIDIPLTISKSRKEVSLLGDSENYANHMIDTQLLDRLRLLFEEGKLVASRHKRKKKQSQQQNSDIKRAENDHSAVGGVIFRSSTQAPSTSQSSISSSAPQTVSGGGIYDSIYDDDVPLGKYVPAEQLEDGEEGESTSVSTNPVQTSAKESLSAKNIFSQSIFSKNSHESREGGIVRRASNSGSKLYLPPSTTSAMDPLSCTSSSATRSAEQGTADDDIGNEGVDVVSRFDALPASQQQLLQPVKQFLEAHARKERAVELREAKVLGSKPVEKMTKLERMAMEVGLNDNTGDKDASVHDNGSSNRPAHSAAAPAGVIHRDVFSMSSKQSTSKKGALAASSNLSATSKIGDRFGMHGSYDYFPETSGFDNQYMSDDDDEDGGPRKKSKLTALSNNRKSNVYDDDD